MLTIYRKELADYFTSIRVFILFLLALLVSAAALYSAYLGIRGTTSSGLIFLKLFTTQAGDIPALFTFINFTSLIFVPIIGIALGFDAINSERSNGTLSRILTQPVYRDNVINAKFLAGIATLSLMVLATILIIAGYGLRMIGVPPSPEEIIRLFIFLIMTIIYGAFWMGLAILFSVLFRRMSTSLLTPVAIWLFFFFYTVMLAPAIANVMVPVTQGDMATAIRHVETLQALQRVSPNFLFVESSMVLLQPPQYGTLLLVGIPTTGNPLSLGQSILLVWPHITGLVSLTAICFAVSYVLFMRQEIRST